MGKLLGESIIVQAGRQRRGHTLCAGQLGTKDQSDTVASPARGDRAMSDLDEVSLVLSPTERYLNPRQLQDYRAERKACIRWLPTSGKDPGQASAASMRVYCWG